MLQGDIVDIFLCGSDLGRWKQSVSDSPRGTPRRSSRHLHAFLLHQTEHLPSAVSFNWKSSLLCLGSERRNKSYVFSVHHSAPCQEILLWFLKHSETSAALPLLRQLSGLRERGNDVAAAFHFTAGGDGGVRLVCRQTCRWRCRAEL